MNEHIMTDWEKEWMEEAPQDCLRTFRLNKDAPGGFSEYGETMLDFDSTETLTEENGKASISLLKADEVAPLGYGTFLRVYLFGSITNGVPVWEFEDNGEPKNFRSYYVTDANSRWFERHPTGHVDRYRHDYTCEEVIACLKDYPIRSIKTFAEGAYTFGECLDIAFRLAFRPRSVGNYKYVIKPFPGLEEPNSKLEYPNSTLYDVVSDIGRIIDAVPSMELTFENGVYTFELSFIDRYGLEGEVHDISYFNMKLNDAVNMERGTAAGTSISNVQNLKSNKTRYPASNGIKPIETNVSNNYATFVLPYLIDEIASIDIYTDKQINNPSGSNRIYFDDGRQQSFNVFPLQYGDLTFRNPLHLENGKSIEIYANDVAIDRAAKKRIFLYEYDEYKFKPPTGNADDPTQDKSIYYKRGDNTLFLNALFNSVYVHFGYALTGSGTSEMKNELYYSFASKPDNKQVFAIAVNYKPMVNGVIKGINSKTSDLTVFFNQQAQVVDIQAFGTSVTNYTKSMFGESRIACHTYYNIGRREMYAEMPKVGSSVIDKERGKRYVVTGYSFTRKMKGGLYMATLAESRAGKSRYIIADNKQRCYAIPSENVVDSMSHTHIICKMGVQSPFDGESNNAVIKKPYLFNALIGTPHGMETQLGTVDLNIKTKEGDKNTKVDTFLSRIRLSAIVSFRMMSNTAVRIVNSDPIKYTDGNGQLKSIQFTYKANDDTAISFSQELDKDSYEILNHTTQTSWVEYGNLRIHENLIDMSYFGNGEGLNEPLQLVLLSSRMRLNDNLAEHTVARYNVSYQDTGNTLMFTANGLATIPQHVGWAIARGNKVILLDNFAVLTDNTVKVYYSVEVRD